MTMRQNSALRGWRGAVCALVCAIAVGFLAATTSAATDPAHVDVRTTGSVRVQPAKAGSSIGQVIRLADDRARATLEFSDGSTVQIVGPAVVQIVDANAAGRRIQLVDGVISEARVRGIALEVQTPYDASFVLQNATGFARVVGRERVTFQRRDGEYARVHSAGVAYDLKTTPWSLNLRQPSTTAPAQPSQAVQRAPEFVMMPHDRASTMLGGRVIVIEPASQFKRTDLPGGDLRLCYQGKDGFGVVYVGTDTVLFLAPRECVEFDPFGNVIAFEGISHMYHPLSEELPYEESVENAADVSISRSTRR